MSTKSLTRFNFILLVFTLLTACGSGPDQVVKAVSAPEVAKDLTQDPITSIQKRFRQVNKWLTNANLNMDSIEYNCHQQLQGGNIKYYRHEGELVMLKHDYYQGEHSWASETFYLRNEQPIFIFVEEGFWEFAGPLSDDDTKPNTQENITEYRYYFEDYEANKEAVSIKCLKKDYVIRSWVELPTEADQVPNKLIDCNEHTTATIGNFKKWINYLQDSSSNCPI